MTCKDCLHYEAHKHFFKSDDYKKDFDDYFNDKHVENKCPEFANRSDWLHLPCKVGDRIWYIRNGRVAFRLVSKSSIYSIATSGKLGKTAFLTREEAEKALEVMK